MDRLFLDANVLFSAAYRPKSGLTILWKLKQVTLLTSPYAIEEARRNLQHDLQRARLRRLLRSVEEIQTVTSQPLDAELPAKDEPILRAALSGNASHLITGDLKHFGRFFAKRAIGILVLPPTQYLRTQSR